MQYRPLLHLLLSLNHRFSFKGFQLFIQKFLELDRISIISLDFPIDKGNYNIECYNIYSYSDLDVLEKLKR